MNRLLVEEYRPVKRMIEAFVYELVFLHYLLFTQYRRSVRNFIMYSGIYVHSSHVPSQIWTEHLWMLPLR